MGRAVRWAATVGDVEASGTGCQSISSTTDGMLMRTAHGMDGSAGRNGVAAYAKPSPIDCFWSMEATRRSQNI